MLCSFELHGCNVRDKIRTCCLLFRRDSSDRNYWAKNKSSHSIYDFKVQTTQSEPASDIVGIQIAKGIACHSPAEEKVGLVAVKHLPDDAGTTPSHNADNGGRTSLAPVYDVVAQMQVPLLPHR